ncbi:protein UsfY [Mycobacterium sp. 050128]|uniref:protein UsfY n=1 Tax=Mycobacterium sp. 050128 TaxID=3096112 RepID=UPI002ED9C5E0
MADSRDPIDHFRTTQQHAGEAFIDIYCWPGLLSIALGVMSLIGCVAAAAYRHPEWLLTMGIVGAMAIAGGTAWLMVEHHRVLRIEDLWRAEHSETPPALSRVPFRPTSAVSRPYSRGTTACVNATGSRPRDTTASAPDQTANQVS